MSARATLCGHTARARARTRWPLPAACSVPVSLLSIVARACVFSAPPPPPLPPERIGGGFWEDKSILARVGALWCAELTRARHHRFLLFSAAVVVHHVPPDVKEAQAVVRRREAEQARHERIFDVKQRTIGIDNEALQSQIAAKEAAAKAERERELALDSAMIATARQADVLQQEVDRIKRQQELEIAAYRSKHQPKTTRREWDLNDPDEVKKDTIPTVRPCPVLLRALRVPGAGSVLPLGACWVCVCSAFSS
eukprot:COSAG06_NODE_2136_length_7521_cov_5.249461_4_plen_253_part_00